MNRQGTATGPSQDESDRKGSAVSRVGVTARTRSPTRAARSQLLTDFADEFLANIYSNLDFKDRQVTRRACRRLLEFVDTATPGAEELKIIVGPGDRISFGQVTMTPSGPSFGGNYKNVFIRVGFTRLPLSLLQSRLPPLHSIRPKKLFLPIMNDDLFPKLMQLLVEHQVPRSVSSIELVHGMPLWPGFQVQQGCRNFDQMSQCGVRTLSLRYDPSLLSVALNFPRLLSLSFTHEGGLTPENFQMEIRELKRLSSHPSLRELFLRSASILC